MANADYTNERMKREKNDADYETQHVVQHFDLSARVVLVRSFVRLLNAVGWNSHKPKA